jgi:hypothetical protein
VDEAWMQRVLYLAGISIRGVQRCRYRYGAANGAVDGKYKQSKQTYQLDIYSYILVRESSCQPLLDNCIPSCIELLLASQSGMRMT